MAGVLVSMKGVRVLTAADVLCGKVVCLVMGEMGGSPSGASVGGEMGAESVIVGMVAMGDAHAEEGLGILEKKKRREGETNNKEEE